MLILLIRISPILIRGAEFLFKTSDSENVITALANEPCLVLPGGPVAPTSPSIPSLPSIPFSPSRPGNPVLYYIIDE